MLRTVEMFSCRRSLRSKSTHSTYSQCSAPGRAFLASEFHAWASVSFRPATLHSERRQQRRCNPTVREFQAQRTLSGTDVYLNMERLRNVTVAVPLRSTHASSSGLYSSRARSGWLNIWCALSGRGVCAKCASDPLWREQSVYHRHWEK